VTTPTDAALLARQDRLQAEAAAFARELALEKGLGRAGRVVPLGSAQAISAAGSLPRGG
jgi:hypothetical protein